MKKLKLLCWSDAPSPIVNTGFSKVAKYVLKGLYNTGKYDIYCLAINYFGNFFDKEETPYQVVPAKLLNPNDPFGFAMLDRELNENKYDVLFIINDIYVAQQVTKKIQEIKAKQPNLKIVFYYPVDCSVRADSCDFIKLADIPIAYNNWSVVETIKVLPQVAKKLKVINHGVDNSVYKPLNVSEKAQWRKNLFNVDNPDTFVFVNVNRNSPRKDLPRCIWAFNELKKQTKRDMRLYLHTMAKDQGIDLIACINSLGLSMKTDVILPNPSYNLIKAFPEELMNKIYNAADAHITTTLGEGHGLTISDSMGAGTLTINPMHTSFYEITDNGNRSVTYQCKDICFIDNSGYRPYAHIEDIVKAMKEAMELPKEQKNNFIKLSKDWAISMDWKNIQQQWVKLFEELEHNTYNTEILHEVL